MKKAVWFDGVHFAYADAADQAETLRGIDLTINEGEFIAIIGHNGSGKSTLSKHINALFLPTEGDVLTMEMNTKDETHLFAIRKSAGMVFQNPDNQMVTSIVEEDVAFGPENLGIPSDEIRRRVDDALAAVDMQHAANMAPHHLSGGQKQRIAIAGVLAMEPDILILDESTAMLDPAGRKEVLKAVLRLREEQSICIIWITHFMDEAALADRVVVLSDGQIHMEGTPLEIFEQKEKVEALGLDLPFGVQLADQLHRAGITIRNTKTEEELVEELCRCLSNT